MVTRHPRNQALSHQTYPAVPSVSVIQATVVSHRSISGLWFNTWFNAWSVAVWMLAIVALVMMLTLTGAPVHAEPVVLGPDASHQSSGLAANPHVAAKPSPANVPSTSSLSTSPSPYQALSPRARNANQNQSLHHKSQRQSQSSTAQIVVTKPAPAATYHVAPPRQTMRTYTKNSYRQNQNRYDSHDRGPRTYDNTYQRDRDSRHNQSNWHEPTRSTVIYTKPVKRITTTTTSFYAPTYQTTHKSVYQPVHKTARHNHRGSGLSFTISIDNGTIKYSSGARYNFRHQQTNGFHDGRFGHSHSYGSAGHSSHGRNCR